MSADDERFIIKGQFTDKAQARAKAVETVRELGDLGKTKLRHFSYFKSVGQQRLFMTSVLARGYQIDDAHDQAPGERPFAVVFSCIIFIPRQSPDATYDELSDLSARFDGEYDGWEIEVPHRSEVTN